MIIADIVDEENKNDPAIISISDKAPPKTEWIDNNLSDTFLFSIIDPVELDEIKNSNNIYYTNRTTCVSLVLSCHFD